MKTRFKLTTMAFAMLTASAAWGQAATVCNTEATPNPTITIAVASNFYGPAQALVADFTQAGAPGAGKVIRVCHNSSGLLVNEINAGTPYSLFLAADADWPGEVDESKRGPNEPFTYAYGIPVLWSAKVATDGLMNGNAINKANVTSLAIGNPNLAPYGAAAVEILTGMGQWPDDSGWITQYDNIALTKTAIETKAKDAGFVSKAQVCTQLGDGYGVKDGFPIANIEQKGIQIANVDSTSTTKDFTAYLLSDAVQNRLVTDFCYASSLATGNNAKPAARRR